MEEKRLQIETLKLQKEAAKETVETMIICAILSRTDRLMPLHFPPILWLKTRQTMTPAMTISPNLSELEKEKMALVEIS